MHSTITALLARTRSEEISRAAATPSGFDGVVIRRSRPADARPLERLARLDGRRAPRGEVLLAEVDGEPAAAVPLDGGPAIADPFRPTAAILDLLHLRARQIRRTA